MLACASGEAKALGYHISDGNHQLSENAPFVGAMIAEKPAAANFGTAGVTPTAVNYAIMLSLYYQRDGSVKAIARTEAIALTRHADDRVDSVVSALPTARTDADSLLDRCWRNITAADTLVHRENGHYRPRR